MRYSTRQSMRLAVTSLAALAFFSATVNAHAQDYYPPPSNAQPPPPPPPPPNGPPPPLSAQAPNGEYVAPLQQPTQQIYIPQSVAMSGPRTITDWDETQPVPPGYHVQQHVRTGLIVGGAVLFGTLYLISALTAAGTSDSGSSGDNLLYVPAAGPFLQMANTSSSVGNVFLAIDGLGQCAGVAMLVYGLAAPRSILVRNDLGISTPLILPMRIGQDGYGAGIFARF